MGIQITKGVVMGKGQKPSLVANSQCKQIFGFLQ
jgi:hypothetical protein